MDTLLDNFSKEKVDEWSLNVRPNHATYHLFRFFFYFLLNFYKKYL